MTTILRIDASARTARSLSRALADRFTETWRELRPGDRVVRRDLGREPPPAISEAWIAAAFRAQGERTKKERALLALSDRLIDELAAAEVLVLSTPMYNYGMPAALKAWFDQVIRIGRTFDFDLARGDRPLRPLLTGRTLVVLSSAGEFGFEPGELNGDAGHLLPHIRTCARYLGVEATHHVGIEYQEFADTRHEESKASALQAAGALVHQLVERFATLAPLDGA